MISEKTAELNLTAELLGWLFYVTGKTHIALAPSQRVEGKVGYDASFHGGGWPVALIQFKRAYVTSKVWEWQLNRTKRKDQHSRLQYLESLGFPVLYAFPFFSTPLELRSRRRRLLVSTFWYPPSYITPNPPVDQHHEVFHDPSNGTWWVNSPEKVAIRAPLGPGAIIDLATRERRRTDTLETFVEQLNAALVGFDESPADVSPDQDLSGQALIVVYSEQAIPEGATQ